MPDDIIPDSPQNSFLDDINNLTKTLTNIGNSAAGVYSSFIGANTTAQLAASQKTTAALQPTVSELNAINANRNKTINIVTYLGIGLAALGSIAIIYKMVRS